MVYYSVWFSYVCYCLLHFFFGRRWEFARLGMAVYGRRGFALLLFKVE
jgi:hypothetical protein